METTEKTELSILSEISRISNSYTDLSEKLRRIVEVVARGMGKDGASVFLIDRSGKNVTLSAAIGLNQESIGKLSFPLGMGIAGWVAEQKVPLALEDPYSDPRFQYVPESGIEHFKSLVAAPIMDQDHCLGVIFVLSSSVWSATSSDITLLTTTANQISGVIKKRPDCSRDIQDRLAELCHHLRDRHGAHLHARPRAAPLAHRQEQHTVPPRPGLHHPAHEPARDRNR